MQAKIVCYRFPKISPSQRASFHKAMYGYTDFSNRGKYRYKRKGVLDCVKCKKILDSVIVTNEEGAKSISKILKKYRAKIYIFSILAPFKL